MCFFINKTFEPALVEIRLVGHPEAKLTIVGGGKIELGANSTKEHVMFLSLPPSNLIGAKTPIVFEIIKDGEIIDTSSTNFLGPFEF